MYSPQVLDHFQNPRNAGDLANATATVQVENPVCGDVMRLAARIAEGRLAEVRFKTSGCVTAIACGSLLTTWMKGREFRELNEITYPKISEALGGLPPATVHGAQLAVDALRALLAQLAKTR
jgi:nitrogen fixation NifU-like protein